MLVRATGAWKPGNAWILAACEHSASAGSTHAAGQVLRQRPR